MANEVQIVEDKPTGRLSLKHRAAAVAIGGLLIWLGNKFIKASTYEEVEQIINEGEERAKQIEETYGDDPKLLG